MGQGWGHTLVCGPMPRSNLSFEKPAPKSGPRKLLDNVFRCVDILRVLLYPVCGLLQKFYFENTNAKKGGHILTCVCLFQLVCSVHTYRHQNDNDMVFVSQEYVGGLRFSLDTERRRVGELEEEVQRLKSELSALKVRSPKRVEGCSSHCSIVASYITLGCYILRHTCTYSTCARHRVY